LTIWLKESGLSHTTIGLFVGVTTPYTFKFLWGPMVDRVKIPLLFKVLGQRRSWALVSQVALIFMLLGLGSCDPRDHVWTTAFWAFGVAFCSAIQDIVVEAYRIEVVDINQRGSAASSTYIGYRLGMMMSGYGALFLAATYSWETSYFIMAGLMGIGLIATLFSPSPKALVFSPAPHLSLKSQALHHRFGKWLRLTYGPPLQDLLHNYDWRVVLAFIFFYKVGDTTLNVMSNPFLMDLGFSTLEIAHVAKLFGISAMIVGGLIGGVVLNRYGIHTSLLLCSCLQVLSSLMFVLQGLVGYNLSLLIVTIGVENLTCGLGAAAFISYLSSLCNTPHTATHFALLSSFGSFARVILSMAAGVLADSLSWPTFFTCTTIACLPCLLLLIQRSHHFPYVGSFRRKPQPS
jgi:PAT family beta-lactamase induction signal transducer AmpG